MKIQHLYILPAITLLFLGFVLGFFVGRNTVETDLTVSVPYEMQTLPVQTEATEETREITFPIDLNKADKEELMALPRIGETLAFRILSYRRERGRFFSLTDLLQVQGITQSILEEIEDLVIIGG